METIKDIAQILYYVSLSVSGPLVVFEFLRARRTLRQAQEFNVLSREKRMKATIPLAISRSPSLTVTVIVSMAALPRMARVSVREFVGRYLQRPGDGRRGPREVHAALSDDADGRGRDAGLSGDRPLGHSLRRAGLLPALPEGHYACRADRRNRRRVRVLGRPHQVEGRVLRAGGLLHPLPQLDPDPEPPGAARPGRGLRPG
jgi:hypothetical protein